MTQRILRVEMCSFLKSFLFWTSLLLVDGKEVTSTTDPVSQIRHLLPQTDLSSIASTNITVQTGITSFLPCRFRHLADHQVSWFRRRDWHILTTGLTTYTNDERFLVLHPPDSDVWTLQLKYTQLRDAGLYECQLSTGTGATSQFVNLHVVEPRARILGGSEYHVQLGSTIKLICIIDQTPTPPEFVFWFRDRHMINYDTSRGGINVSTILGSETKSFLTINNATADDSGNYSCTASNTREAHTNVFVSFGDKMAAILRRKSSIGNILSLSPIVAFFCIFSASGLSIDFFIKLFLELPYQSINLLRKNSPTSRRLIPVTR